MSSPSKLVYFAPLLISLAGWGCGGTNPPTAFQPLPLRGDSQGPVVQNVWLGCQAVGDPCTEVLVTHPLGFGDDGLSEDQNLGVLHVFPNADGTGAPDTRTFHMTGTGSVFQPSGCGGFFGGQQTQSVWVQICASDTWPVEIEISDRAGRVTRGKVLANVCQRAYGEKWCWN